MMGWRIIIIIIVLLAHEKLMVVDFVSWASKWAFIGLGAIQ